MSGGPARSTISKPPETCRPGAAAGRLRRSDPSRSTASGSAPPPARLRVPALLADLQAAPCQALKPSLTRLTYLPRPTQRPERSNLVPEAHHPELAARRYRADRGRGSAPGNSGRALAPAAGAVSTATARSISRVGLAHEAIREPSISDRVRSQPGAGARLAKRLTTWP